jgi:tetratricopeptide (TPR) repeat protein
MADFDDLLATANDLLDERKKDEAGPALDAALAAARTPGERALALNGVAFLHFLREEPDRMLELLERSVAFAETHLQTDPQNSHARLALAEAFFEQVQHKFRPDDLQSESVLLDRSLERFLKVTSEPPRDRYDRQLRRVMARTLSRKASNLSYDTPKEAVDCYTQLLDRFQDIDDAILKRICAYAAVRRGEELGDLGRSDQQLATYDDVIVRYSGFKEHSMREVVLRALEGKLLAYREQEDFEATLEACDELLERFEGDTIYYATDAVARTLIRKGDVLNKLGKTGPELACYDRVVATWANSEDRTLRKHAAEALLAKAVALNEADQAAAEMECYEDLLRRYAEDEDQAVRSVAAQALVYMGYSLRAIAEDAAEDTGVLETDAEIACYDRAIDRYGEEDWDSTRRAVAAAFQHKGESLLETGRSAEAAGCFDAIIERYAQHIGDPVLDEIVQEARNLRKEC